MSTINELPVMDLTDNETGCCPRFQVEPWDNKTLTFDKMMFAKASSRSFMHIPLNFGKMMTKTQALIDKAEAWDNDRYMILSQDTSSWKADHYFKVTKDVPGVEMASLSGTYMTKVYDAEYRDIPKLMKGFENIIKDSGKAMDEFSVFYTTCPKCAKHYGHNYMVFFGKVDD